MKNNKHILLTLTIGSLLAFGALLVGHEVSSHLLTDNNIKYANYEKNNRAVYYAADVTSFKATFHYLASDNTLGSYEMASGYGTYSSISGLLSEGEYNGAVIEGCIAHGPSNKVFVGWKGINGSIVNSTTSNSSLIIEDGVLHLYAYYENETPFTNVVFHYYSNYQNAISEAKISGSYSSMSDVLSSSDYISNLTNGAIKYDTPSNKTFIGWTNYDKYVIDESTSNSSLTFLAGALHLYAYYEGDEVNTGSIPSNPSSGGSGSSESTSNNHGFENKITFNFNYIYKSSWVSYTNVSLNSYEELMDLLDTSKSSFASYASTAASNKTFLNEWTTEKNGGTTIDDNFDFSGITQMDLYAKYSTTIYFYNYESSPSSVVQTANTEAVDYKDVEKYCDNGFGTHVKTESPSGKAFAGWSLTENGEIITENIDFNGAESINLYAIYKDALTVNFYFNPNGAGDNYYQVGSCSNCLNFGEAKQYSPNSNSGYSSTIGTVLNNQGEGKTFIGWYTQQDGGELVTDDYVWSKDTPLNVYAHYSNATRFNVQFYTPSGDPAVSVSNVGYFGACEGYSYFSFLSYVKGTTCPSGKVFLGWYTDPTNGELITSDYTQNGGTLNAYPRYGEPTPDSLSISFEYNGTVIGTIDSLQSGTAILDVESSFPVFPSSSIPEGYEFVGWTLKEGSTTAIKSTDKVNKNITLYPIIIKISIKVEFYVDSNLVGTTYSELSNGVNSTVTAPEKTGYTFIGWYDEDDNEFVNGEDFASSYDSNRVCKVHAVYEANPTITITLKDGTSTYDTISGLQGTGVESLPSPTKTGYIFVGWYYDAELNSDDLVTDDIVYSEDLTLYARFVEDTTEVDEFTYIVITPTYTSFDSSYQTEYKVASTLKLYDVLPEPVLPDTVWSEQYEFVGWGYFNEETQKAEGLIQKDALIFELDTYYKNGHSTGVAPIYKMKARIYTYYDKNHKYKTTALPLGTNLYDYCYDLFGDDIFDEYGNVFTGYNVFGNDLDCDVTESMVVEECELGSSTHLSAVYVNPDDIDEDITITLVCEYDHYLNGKTFTMNQYQTYLTQYNRGVAYDENQNLNQYSINEDWSDGYIIYGLYYDANYKYQINTNAGAKYIDHPTSTIYVRIIPNAGRIYYKELNGGNLQGLSYKYVNYNCEIGELKTPTRKGYEFLGWYLDEDLTIPVNEHTKAIFTEENKDINLYAKWSEPVEEVHTVTYIIPGNDNQEFTGISGVRTNVNINVEGKSIVGWYYDAAYTHECDEPYVFDDEDIVLYARLVNEDEYLVEFYKDKESTKFISSYMSDSTENIQYPEVEIPEGMKLVGWYESSLNAPLSNRLCYYPKFADITYEEPIYLAHDVEITVFEGQTSTYSYNEGCVITQMSSPKYYGYIFEGWYYDAEFTKPVPKSNYYLMPNYDIHVYAKWTSNNANVTFVYPSQIRSSNYTEKFEIGDVLTVSHLNYFAYSSSNYTFAGWYYDSAYTQPVNSDVAVPSSGLTLYAKYINEVPKAKIHLVIGNGFDDIDLTFSPNADRYYVYNTIMNSVSEKTANGKTFTWFYYDEENVYIYGISTFGAGEHTLYARWQEGEVVWGNETYRYTYYDENGNYLTEVYYMEGDILRNPDYKVEGYADTLWVNDYGNSLYTGQNIWVSANANMYAKGWSANYAYVELKVKDSTGKYKYYSSHNWYYGSNYNPYIPDGMTSKCQEGYHVGYWSTKKDGSDVFDISSIDLKQQSYSIILYAIEVPNEYTISFEVAGQTNPDSITATYTEEISSLPTPTRAGATFLGWYTSTGADGVKYENGSTFNIPHNTKLYARFSDDVVESTKHTITYKFNNGDDDVAITAYKGELIASYEDSYKKGYTFLGWYEDEACTIPVTDDLSVMIDRDITVYAKLVDNDYVIHFVVEDGASIVTKTLVKSRKGETTSSNTKDVDVDIDTVLGDVMPSATKEDYKFLGWYTKEDASGSQVNDDTTFESLVTSDSQREVTLYAQFAPETIGEAPADVPSAVFYYATSESALKDDGLTDLTKASSSTEIEFEDYSDLFGEENASGLATITSLLSGYTFVGWYLYDDGAYTETKITSSSTYDVEQKYGDSVRLVAKYTKNEQDLTVKFVYASDEESLTDDGYTNVEHTWTITTEKWDITSYDQFFTDYSSYVNTMEKQPPEGYTFDGWYLYTADGQTSTKITSESSISSSQAVDGVITLVAKYKAVEEEKPTATFYYASSAAGILASGYANVGNSNVSSSEAFEIDSYADLLSGNSAELAAMEAAPAGYSFDGWYIYGTDTKVTNELVYADSQLSDGTVKIVAKYKETEKTTRADINFKDNISTVKPGEEFTIVITSETTRTGTTWSSADVSIYSEYFANYVTYVGHSVTLEDGTSYNDINGTTIEKGTNPYSYHAAVSFNNVDASSKYDTAMNITFNITFKLSASATNIYDTEVGFYTYPAGNKYVYANGAIDTKADVATNHTRSNQLVFTVAHEENSVTYKPGTNGTGTEFSEVKYVDQETFEGYDAYFVSSTKFAREGYTQIGWSTTDGGALEYEFGAMYTENEDLVLYPVWQANKYTITYVSNGGNSIASAKVAYKEAVTKPTNPTKEGYIFRGWYTDDGTFLNEFDFSSMPNSDVTVYARWMKNILELKADGTEGYEFIMLNVRQESYVIDGTSYKDDYYYRETYLSLGISHGDEDDGTRVILGNVKANTSLRAFLAQFKTDVDCIKVTAANGTVIFENGHVVESLLGALTEDQFLDSKDAFVIATGTKVQLSVKGVVTDTIYVSVLGDINKDGTITANDYQALKARITTATVNDYDLEVILACYVRNDGAYERVLFSDEYAVERNIVKGTDSMDNYYARNTFVQKQTPNDPSNRKASKVNPVSVTYSIEIDAESFKKED